MELENVILDKVKDFLGEDFKLEYEFIKDHHIIRFEIFFDSKANIDPFDINGVLKTEIDFREKKLEALKKVLELAKDSRFSLLLRRWERDNTILQGVFVALKTDTKKWVKSINEYFSQNPEQLIKKTQKIIDKVNGRV